MGHAFKDTHGEELAVEDAVMAVVDGERRRMRVRVLYTTGTNVDEAQLKDGEDRDVCVRCDELEKVTPAPDEA